MGMTLEKLSASIGAQILGNGKMQIAGCAGLEEAGPDEVSFVANPKYIRKLQDTKAGAVILSAHYVKTTQKRPLLVADDPYFAFREAMVILHGFRQHPQPDISDKALIHPTATLGKGCCIHPMVFVAASARIADRCVVYPNSYIGTNVIIGDDCVIYPNVAVYDGCVLGNRVTLHSGSVVGQDGLGYATHGGVHHKIPQVGNVVIEDDVEIGANCAIDRATVGSTLIGKGTKLSDLVTIGHGTRIGPHNMIVAQVGIAGSVQTGAYVSIAGQAGIAGHLKIGDQAQVAAKSGVISDVPDKMQVGGQPSLPLTQAKRNYLAQAKMPQLLQQFKQLQKRVAELESQAEMAKTVISDTDG